MKKFLVLLMLCLSSAIVFGQSTDATPAVETDNDEQIYDVVEQYPEFPGGYKALTQWINDNMKYSAEAVMKGVEGRVIVQFIIRPTGKVTNAKVARGIDPSLDEEALRLVRSMPDWTPGRQNGRTVNVRYTLPITFKL